MRKILIAEDNTELNDMMRNYLLKAGHTVYQAFNGAQALEYARSMHPDLVLLDIMMPVIDGYEVCSPSAASTASPSSSCPPSWARTRSSVCSSSARTTI